jgi:hypothetical protein
MRVIISYKNFAANRNISHIGLGVAALNNSKCLNRAGIITDVWSTMDAADLTRQLKANTDVSHVVISAPWIPTVDLQKMTMEFPRIKFAMNCHSNVGFLQADANGVGLIGAAMEVQRGTANFHVAGNSRRFVDWASVTLEHRLPICRICISWRVRQITPGRYSTGVCSGSEPSGRPGH